MFYDDGMSPALLGLIRGVGTAVIMAIATYLANAANLNGIVGAGTGAIIAGIALMVEHVIEGQTGNALFGAVRTK